MAFPAFKRSVGHSDVDPPVLVETCDEGQLSDTDEEFNLQKAYNQLFKECCKLKKKNDALHKKLNEMKFESKSLCEQVHNLTNVCDSLRIENSKLVDDIDCLVASQYDVPHESNIKLDKILSFRKSHWDRCKLLRMKYHLRKTHLHPN